MANIAIEDTNVQDLRQRASRLASAVGSLATLFDDEATRLRRSNEVARLASLRVSILQQLERARGDEMAASYGHSKASAICSLVGMATGIIAMASESKMMRSISRELLAGPNGREPHYGTVLIRIGPKGLPEDVDAVSISSLARESKRPESEIIQKLQKGGCLLFSQETFSRLVDKLVIDVREGG